jgi:hypothetical protein
MSRSRDRAFRGLYQTTGGPTRAVHSALEAALFLPGLDDRWTEVLEPKISPNREMPWLALQKSHNLNTSATVAACLTDGSSRLASEIRVSPIAVDLRLRACPACGEDRCPQCVDGSAAVTQALAISSALETPWSARVARGKESPSINEMAPGRTAANTL